MNVISKRDSGREVEGAVKVDVRCPMAKETRRKPKKGATSLG